MVAVSDFDLVHAPAADFNVAVMERMKLTGEDRKRAVVAVARANPEMHQAFLLAHNPKKAHALIRDRFAVV